MAIQEKLMGAVVEHRLPLAAAAALAAVIFSFASLGPSIASVAGFFWPLLVSTAFLLVVVALLFRISPPTEAATDDCGELIDFVAGKPEDAHLHGSYRHDAQQQLPGEAATAAEAEAEAEAEGERKLGSGAGAILSTMQGLRNAITNHVRLSCSTELLGCRASGILVGVPRRRLCASSGAASLEDLRTRVLDLVKKYDKIDASKVNETADFQKDLSLDSLDRVELVMVIEQEFSVEIPDDKADKLSCCADVVKYISEARTTKKETS